MHVQNSNGMIDLQSSTYDKGIGGVESAMSSQNNNQMIIDSGDRRDRPLANATFGIFDEGAANVGEESTEKI